MIAVVAWCGLFLAVGKTLTALCDASQHKNFSAFYNTGEALLIGALALNILMR